jgi:hypothetical protein
MDFTFRKKERLNTFYSVLGSVAWSFNVKFLGIKFWAQIANFFS